MTKKKIFHCFKKTNSFRIYHMRNLNNWIKSQLVNEYANRVKDRKRQNGDRSPLTILDLGCGKGGDLLKWSKAGADAVVCADIAETSVEQCRNRYNEMKNRQVFFFAWIQKLIALV